MRRAQKNGKKGDVREHRLGLPYSAIPSLRRYSKDVLAKVPSDDCRQLLKQYYLLYQKNGINPDINQWETTWYIHILEIPTIIVNEDAIYPLIQSFIQVLLLSIISKYANLYL